MRLPTSVTLFGSTILMLNTYRVQNSSTADSVSRLRHGERGRGGLLQRHRLRASALQCWRFQVVPSSTSCVLKMIQYDWHSIKQHNQWKQSTCQNLELSKLQHFFFSLSFFQPAYLLVPQLAQWARYILLRNNANLRASKLNRLKNAFSLRSAIPHVC